ncbi:hypothetical protein BDV93DRAFT_526949 [Ceratobasidium sp. AG-I]|nr:hypothetical protein BDV93DRAFT_526949 [Ceratobasidium sp. AG-I]
MAPTRISGTPMPLATSSNQPNESTSLRTSFDLSITPPPTVSIASSHLALSSPCLPCHRIPATGSAI